MARRGNKGTLELRVKEAPKTLHRRIVVHQKILSLKSEKEITIDEACLDLISRGLDEAGVPAGN